MHERLRHDLSAERQGNQRGIGYACVDDDPVAFPCPRCGVDLLAGRAPDVTMPADQAWEDMADGALTLERGDVIGARYRVERVLGKSVTALVVAAHDQQLDELVAIKILLPRTVANAEMRARFGREARAAGKIKGEHVARVTDVGALDDGAPYMVMEYLEGESLASVLARRKRMPPPEAILYILQICEVLREAHALGIVHRDLTPANLFLAKRRGRPPGLKVLDFGISKVDEREGGPRSETARSGAYMAPEQMKSARSVDARSDIWAVGVILFELVVGEVPFDADAKVLNDMPNLRGAPKPLAPIFRRCLAKAPAQRYASVDELAEALRALDGVPLEVEARRSTPPPPRAVIPSLPDPARVSLAPDTVQDEALVVGDDEAVIVDEDEDGELVDEAELLPSMPPPAATLQELPKAPPRVIVWPAKLAPAPAAPKVVEEAGEERSGPTRRPPPPDAPRAQPQPSGAARRRWFALAAVAMLIPAGVFVAGRLVNRRQEVKPEPSQAAPLAIQMPPPSAPAPPVSVEAPNEEPRVVAAAVESVVAPPSPGATPPGAKVARPAQRPEVAAPAAAKSDDNATVAVQAAMRNHARLRQACWETSDKTTQVVSVSVSVDPSGAVTSANASSADAKLAECVAAQVRSWSFSPSTSPRSLQVPIRFRR